ncbi:MAG: T9SS type A sorting domain-containing protein [Bacteroidia bacterium]|nr:T9SS type A sorting domain-containing protein [Bacteroidia bacterium]
MKRIFSLSFLLLLAFFSFAQSPGDIQVVEVMQNPADLADAVSEWFEVRNTTNAAIDMNGWIIRDKDLDLDTINNGGPLMIAAGGYLVFGVNADTATNGGYHVDYQWSSGSTAIGNGIDEMIIALPNGTVIDSIQWDNGLTFPDPNGKSMVFTGCDGDDNAIGSFWVEATLREPSFAMNGNTDKGSPGTAGIFQSAPGTNLTTGGTDASCGANADGSAFVHIKGCAGPYTVLWSNNATTDTITNLAAGTYVVTVTDSGSVTYTDTVVVGSAGQISTSGTVTPTACGSNSGAIDLTVAGNAPFTFLWNNAATTEDLMNLAAGNYIVTVTDSGGCTAKDTFTVSQVGGINSLSFVLTLISCAGGANGAIDLTVSGGTSPFTYSWSNSATTQDISGLSAGTFVVTVTDNNGCALSDSATLNDPLPLSLNFAATDASCPGVSNGAIDLTVTGGTAPYTYVWNNSATTQDISGLAPGAYNVTVTDSKGCTAMGSENVGQGSGFTLTMSSTPEHNSNMDATATATPSGGNPPYTYAWSPGGGTTQTISNLSGNQSYTVTVNDANGCSATDSVSPGVVIGLTEDILSQIQIYPNPAKDQVSIETYFIPEKITLHDALGRVLIEVLPDSKLTTLQISGIGKGLYFLKIQYQNNSVSSKLLRD